MITMTLGACDHAYDALVRLSGIPAPPKTAYRIAKLCRPLAAEAKHFREQRDALIRELGEEREATPDERQQGLQGPVTAVKAEHAATFSARLAELAGVVADLDVQPLTVADIETLPQVRGEDLLALWPLLADDESAPTAAERRP